MKTVSLKVTEAERKRREKDMKVGAPVNPNSNEYPWGFRLNLDKDMLKKFPQLADAEGGDTFDFTGKCKVIEITTSSREGKAKNQRVELQITDMGFESNEDKLDDDFESDD